MVRSLISHDPTDIWVHRKFHNNFKTFQFGDVNGDGFPDLAYIDANYHLHVLLNNHNGFQDDNDPGTVVSLRNAPHPHTSIKLIDINADGLADVIYNSGRIVSGRLADGNGGFSIEPVEPWGMRDNVDYFGNEDFRMGDVNGDGLPDFIYRDSDSKIHVLINNGQGFNSDHFWVKLAFWNAGYNSFQMADMNGDGLADLVYDGWNQDSTRGEFRVLISNGNGFEEEETWGWRAIGDSEQLRYAWDAPYFVMTDLNNDGLCDLVWAYTDNMNYAGPIYIHLNMGNSLTEVQKLSREHQGHSQFFGNGYRFADVNGDGLPDLVSDEYDGGSCISDYCFGRVRVRPALGVSPDLVKKIKNGIGGSYTFNYQNTTACAATNLPYNLKVVQSIVAEDGTVVENGNPRTYETSYTYRGGRHSYQDREFLGFSEIRKELPDKTIVVSKFHQDGAKKGLLLNQTTMTEEFTFHQVKNDWLERDLPAGAKFPYLDQTSEHIFDKQSTAQSVITDFKYDDYGNVTEKHRYGEGLSSGEMVSRYDYTQYVYNTSRWIVSTPYLTYTRAAPGGPDNSDLARTSLSYYPNTNLVREKEFWFKDGISPVISYEYDEYGNLRRQKDPKGNITDTIYDSATQTFPARITGPRTDNSTHTTTIRYDEDGAAGYRFGKQTSTTDVENNLTTRFKYDQYGRISQKFDPNASSQYPTIRYYYNDSGLVGRDNGQYAGAKFREIPNRNDLILSKYSYFDGFGREIRVKYGRNEQSMVSTDTEYGSHGKVRFKSFPYFLAVPGDKKNINYAYDAMGRVTKQLNPDNSQLITVYDRDQVTYFDAEGNRKVERRDPFGRVVNVREYRDKNDLAQYLDTQYFYDVLGNLRTIIDSQGNQTSIEYDTLSRRTIMSDPVFGDWSYDYDANGNLEYQKYVRSETEDVVISYGYDALNRPTVKRYPNPEIEPDVEFFYDEPGHANGVGRLTSVIDASGRSSFDYDYAGRVTASSIQVSIGGQLTDPYTLGRTYDALGRIGSITYPAPDNETIVYGYDNNGNLGSVTRQGGADYAAISPYNAAGMPEAIQFYNGASTLLEYYPENNRLKSVTTNANDLVQQIRYTVYDKNGNVKYIEDGGVPGQAVKTYAYGYDGLNRLRSADSSAYGSLNPIGLDYAGVGNIWKNTVTGMDTFPAERRLVYDSDNRLSAIETDSGLTTFVYNYQGERVIKQSGASTTIYIGGLFEEKGTTKIKHIFAGDRRIVTRINSAPYYYHPDHLGGLSVVTNAAGDVAQKARYYPFGQQINPGAETDLLPYRFTGQELDTETGLYYYKSRYYDPMIGRFISPDPLIQAAFDPPTFPRLIGFEYAGKEAPIVVLNKHSLSVTSEKTSALETYMKTGGCFTYVKNNPVNLLDPSGLAPGSKFNTFYEAAWDALVFTNDMSIRENLEYSGIFYFNRDAKYFSYTYPVEGDKKRVDYSMSQIPNQYPPCNFLVGYYHTHGDYQKIASKWTDDFFSNGTRNGENADLNLTDPSADTRWLALGTPSSRFLVFDPELREVFQLFHGQSGLCFVLPEPLGGFVDVFD